MTTTTETKMTEKEKFKKVMAQVKEQGAPVFYIVVQEDGAPEAEMITNSLSAMDRKMAYYENAYDDNLRHKTAPMQMNAYGFANDVKFDDGRIVRVLIDIEKEGDK
ncbi:hypothetical protein COM97_27200 [Bacillus thuringiensis]|uniref:hypothetical protein n=1 Tax=Bacillus thuringiensis TaxID=1428 RepID=UPI000BEC8678|nr:hypothetical protein [Bacillus thuringiensis]PEF03430.1 hypothetical protein COM97_27200 [Bacillus thuringiensis]